MKELAAAIADTNYIGVSIDN